MLRSAPLLLLLACTGPADSPVDTDDNDTGDTDTDTGDTDTDSGTWYADVDNDGYGNPDAPRTGSTQPAGTVDNALDCNDLDATIRPDAAEVCDTIDNDCDGRTDDADDGLDIGTAHVWYLDADRDSHVGGDTTTLACEPPSGAGDADSITDCDDTDAAIHPDAEEVCGDGVDNDCDGTASGCRLVSGDVSTADIIFFGRASGDRMGSAVALADIDGDGDLDLLTGAPGSELDPIHTGEVTAWTTSATGTVVYADSFGGATIGTGASFVEASFGSTLARIGDRDGDGDDEWLAGGPGYRGHNGGWGYGEGAITFPTIATESWAGDAGNECGRAIAAGADLTGDGEPDWAVGCPERSLGEVRVYSDRATYVTLTATRRELEFGGAIAMDDFDGDGVGDLVVGAVHEQMIYWFAGPVIGGTVAALSDGEAYGTNSDGVLAAVGDPNNDGYPDLVAGAGESDDSYFFVGNAGDLLGPAINMTEHLDAAVGGDLDGDGIDDLVVASSQANEVRIAYGPVNTTFPESDWIEIAGALSGALGSALALGDLDNDGLNDLVMGDADDSTAGAGAGAVYVLLGR